MLFSIIAAVAQNNVIGKDNMLPWDIPGDLEHFYNLVRGKAVVMGYKTYQLVGSGVDFVPLRSASQYISKWYKVYT